MAKVIRIDLKEAWEKAQARLEEQDIHISIDNSNGIDITCAVSDGPKIKIACIAPEP